MLSGVAGWLKRCVSDRTVLISAGCISAAAALVYVASLLLASVPGLRDLLKAKSHVAEASYIEASRVLDSNSWLRSIQSGRYFRNSQSWSSAPNLEREAQSSLGWISDDGWGWPWRGESGSRYTRASVPYRTMCVRTCDGFFFPISASTTRGRFRRDAKACASMCEAPTRLFYYPISADPSHMQDLSGRPYTDLRTAFLYRTAYNGDCKCRPHPWEAASQERHKLYALREQRKKKNVDRETKRELSAEIKKLEASVESSERALEDELETITDRALQTASVDALADRVDQFLVTTPPPWTVDVAGGQSNRGQPAAPESGRTVAKPKRYTPTMSLGAAPQPQSNPAPKAYIRPSARSRSNNYSQRSWREKAFSTD